MDLMDPKERTVCGSRFIISLEGGKYREEEITPSRCTIAFTSIRSPTTKMPFPNKLPSKFMKGLDNYVVPK
jgi:hypothetical protein